LSPASGEPAPHRVRAPFNRRRLRRLAAGGLALALLASLVFALRLGLLLIDPGPAPPSPSVEGWMTPRYVARQFDVSPQFVARTLGIDPRHPQHRSIAAIARARNESPDALAARLAAAIAARAGEAR